MTTTLLAANGQYVKPNAAIAVKVYLRRMARREKTTYWEKSRSGLQTVFVRRLVAVLKARDLSDNQLAKMIAPNSPTSVQRSVSRITACTQDPGLEMVERIAKALDIPVAELFLDVPVRQRTPLVSGNAAPAHAVNTALRNKASKRSASGKS